MSAPPPEGMEPTPQHPAAPPPPPPPPGIAYPAQVYPQMPPQQYPPQPYPGQPPYGGYGVAPGAMKPKQGMAVAAMILGLIAVCLCAYWPLSLPAAITAIILGAVARSKVSKGQAGGGGFALTGIITGSVGIILGIISIFIWASPTFQEDFWEGYCEEAMEDDPWCEGR